MPEKTNEELLEEIRRLKDEHNKEMAKNDIALTDVKSDHETHEALSMANTGALGCILCVLFMPLAIIQFVYKSKMNKALKNGDMETARRYQKKVEILRKVIIGLGVVISLFVLYFLIGIIVELSRL